MKILDVIAWILVVIGGINWGCIGFFDWNLVDFFFGKSIVETIIYDAVGVSAVWLVIRCKCLSSSCKK